MNPCVFLLKKLSFAVLFVFIIISKTQVIHDFNEDADDLYVSCIPDALVLFNLVIDNGPGIFQYYIILSEVHHQLLHFLARRIILFRSKQSNILELLWRELGTGVTWYYLKVKGMGFLMTKKEADHFRQKLQINSYFLY